MQKGIVGLYILVIFLSALSGPKTLLLTVWRFSIALLAYFVSGRMLDWQKKGQPDMLLVPVYYAAGILHNLFCDVVDQYGIFKAYLNSQIMRESLAEIGAVLDPK